MEPFTYTLASKTIFYNGCVFDSLLELKYALMIEDTHAWLYDGLEMYYAINSRGYLRCYRPDFLVRDLVTGEAHLIEIKPDAFNDDSLQKRGRIASCFIKRFAYDWNFRIVRQSEIWLSAKQWNKYQNILTTQDHWRHKPCIQLLQNNTNFSDAEYEQFVRNGFGSAMVP